jgi:hypothetical protein
MERSRKDDDEYETPNAKRLVSGLVNLNRYFLSVFASLADIA